MALKKFSLLLNSLMKSFRILTKDAGMKNSFNSVGSRGWLGEKYGPSKRRNLL